MIPAGCPPIEKCGEGGNSPPLAFKNTENQRVAKRAWPRGVAVWWRSWENASFNQLGRIPWLVLSPNRIRPVASF